MNAIRKLWDEAGNVSEDEPTLGGFIAALAVFTLLLITVFVYLTLFAPVGA